MPTLDNTRNFDTGISTGTILPGFLDAHVHLALIDPSALPAGGIARVLDLGGVSPDTESPVETAYANQFLTAPGGYPSRQGWTPAGSVRVVTSATDARAAVDQQLARGASVIKVTLNSEAGPVLATDTLTAIVARAHERKAPVVVHAQGIGQAVRAFVAGVDVLAHTPFSECLVDELVDAMAARMTWISTLDIHGWGDHDDDFERAGDNLRRFHAHGGRVLYGTDLGNGPLPVGLNRREIDALLAAGMSPDEVLAALTGTVPGMVPGPLPLSDQLRTASDPHPDLASIRSPPSERSEESTARERRVSLVPGERPADPAGFAEWLCAARSLTHQELGDRE